MRPLDAFPEAYADYAEQEGRSVTITNTGNQPTGDLTVTLSDSTAFTLDKTTIDSIAVNENSTFTITPKTGLAAGTYSGTVTVSSGNSINASFGVGAWDSIWLSVETYTFPDAIEGYEAQEAKRVTVTNTGNRPTGNLTITFSTYYSSDSTSAFTLSTRTMSSLAGGETANFTVAPQTGLTEGSYTATITVRGKTSRSFRVSFKVNSLPLSSAPEGSLTSLIDALTYMDSHTGGNSVGNPITLKMHMYLASPANDAFLTTITSLQKYIALDFSSCLMSGTSYGFPGSATTWQKYIVSLVLPDVATAIGDGSEYNRDSSIYPNLKTVSGVNVTTIGDYAFYMYSGLISVSFPKATSIGQQAFRSCTSLTSASFPEAASTGQQAFASCTSLSTVSFPKATSIGGSAFSGCIAMASVSFPEATSIGGSAFSNCTALTSVSFPEVTSIASGTGYHGAFYGCTALATVSFPEVISIGADAFENCTSMTTVNIPKVMTIGGSAFRRYNDYHSIGTLTITMGSTAPAVGVNIFYGVTAAKNVTVRVPSGAEGYTGAWGTMFKGYGSGTTHGTVNGNINLVIQEY